MILGYSKSLIYLRIISGFQTLRKALRVTLLFFRRFQFFRSFELNNILYPIKTRFLSIDRARSPRFALTLSGFKPVRTILVGSKVGEKYTSLSIKAEESCACSHFREMAVYLKRRVLEINRCDLGFNSASLREVNKQT